MEGREKGEDRVRGEVNGVEKRGEERIGEEEEGEGIRAPN